MKYGWMVLLLLFSAGSQAAGTLDHGRFRHVEIYPPKGAPSGFVLLLSGGAGWNAHMAKMAQALSAQGALVAGIDTPQLFYDLNHDDGDCVFPDGDLDNLSRFVQAYEKVPGYLPPLLAGYARGATFAYAVLAQAPDHTFAGALMLDFSPQLNLRKPLCVDEGVKFRKLRHRRGVELLPVQRIKAPLVALQRENSDALAAVQGFFAQVPGAAVVTLPAVKREPGADGDWQPQWQAAYRKLTAAEVKPVAPPASLGNLPVVELPAQALPANPHADMLAVILSGDGGWADLDRSVGKALSQKGVAVVGVDSLRYFWSARTPAGTAADIDRIIRYYTAHWHKKQVLLIGYSQGADVLPFVINRLSADVRPQVALAVGMGLSRHATFEFHMANWVKNDTEGPKTLPEIEAIKAVPFLCIYGSEEDDSVCPEMVATPAAHVLKMPGGHHFDGDYEKLAEKILLAVPR